MVGGWLNEIYTLIWSSARPQNEKWTPNACGYWESISFLSIKLWVALIESPARENPKLGDPERPHPEPTPQPNPPLPPPPPPNMKGGQKGIYDNL